LLVVAPIESQRTVRTPGDDIHVDLSVSQSKSGIAVSRKGTTLQITWPIEGSEQGVLVLQLGAKEPLIEKLGIRKTADGPVAPLLRSVDLVPTGRSASQSGSNSHREHGPTHAAARRVLPLAVSLGSQGARTREQVEDLGADLGWVAVPFVFPV